jgi:glucose-1-phosphate cytidylyltransferase
LDGKEGDQTPRPLIEGNLSMKVVLFCGGYGMRLRDYSESIPKPMVPIGYRPILWHIMKYYAHYGHTDFILCLGWKADVIKDYFLHYDECVSNDFVLNGRDRSVELLASDIDDWNITFVDTGVTAAIGERLKAVEPHLQGESTFLANYADGLSDVHLPSLIDFHHQREAIATLVSVRPTQSFHCVSADESGAVQQIEEIGDTETWMNAGFFVFQQEIFDHLQAGEDLIGEPLLRLAGARQLYSYNHPGFFGCMDTFKEKQVLEDMHARGRAPWAVWVNEPAVVPAAEPVSIAAARANGRSRVRKPR